VKTFLFAVILGAILGAAGALYYLDGGQNPDVEKVQKSVEAAAEQAMVTAADFAGDARITAEIKARLVLDSDLSALNISVSTTDGRVTLSGRVASAELAGKAVRLSYEAKGVREVFSTLQVKGEKS
jgi:osmotically-inducible protein OsmY